eukprot:scaffold9151_cov181-Alexandrium_tamarense.AAC.2
MSRKLLQYQKPQGVKSIKNFNPVTRLGKQSQIKVDASYRLNSVNVAEGMVQLALAEVLLKSKNGEGYLHVHRGVLNVGDLDPMMTVTVTN